MVNKEERYTERVQAQGASLAMEQCLNFTLQGMGTH